MGTEQEQMRSFILLYSGPPTPPNASHEGWPQWFQSIGEKLVDMGSPMAAGFTVHSDGTTSDTAATLNGYSIIRAEDRGDVVGLLRDHPFLAAGSDYTIEVFEVPGK
jgi:YCII-related domain